MKELWDKRYNTDQFIYGTTPNGFLKSELDKLKAGKLLLPGEGEGRNAIYAASRGWSVEAFHTSQLENSTGGPPSLEMIEISQTRVILDEGPLHKGEAEVIQFMARKKQ